jgi:hypothetical protein
VFSNSLLYITRTLKPLVAYLSTFSDSDTTSSKVVRFMNNDCEIISRERILLSCRYILALTDGDEEYTQSLKSGTVRVSAQI